MAIELFDRKVNITIGKRGGEGFSYDDLRVEFDLEKSLESKPNKGSIKVYNLTRDNRSKAEQSATYLILRAGYGKDIETIFKGDVGRSKTELIGTDYVTTFEVGDGEKIYNNAKSDISFSKGTDIKTAMQGILAEVGATLGDITGLKSEKLNSALVLSGPVKNHLDEISKRQGFEWSIQDDEFQILEKGKTTKQEAFILSSETGLIGIPKARFGKDKSDSGIDFDCLLNGKLRPGRPIILSSLQFQGSYRLEKVKFTGGNYSAEFLCRCEARPI